MTPEDDHDLDHLAQVVDDLVRDRFDRPLAFMVIGTRDGGFVVASKLDADEFADTVRGLLAGVEADQETS